MSNIENKTETRVITITRILIFLASQKLRKWRRGSEDIIILVPYMYRWEINQNRAEGRCHDDNVRDAGRPWRRRSSSPFATNRNRHQRKSHSSPRFCTLSLCLPDYICNMLLLSECFYQPRVEKIIQTRFSYILRYTG